MAESKLTIRVPRQTIERAKAYARQHGTTLTRLITAYLEHLESPSPEQANTPLVRQLMGTLPPDVGIEDYRAYLEDKYRDPETHSD